MLGIARWAVALAAGLALFYALGIALSRNDSDTIATLALLAIGLAAVGVLAYVARSLIRGPRYRN